MYTRVKIVWDEGYKFNAQAVVLLKNWIDWILLFALIGRRFILASHHHYLWRN